MNRIIPGLPRLQINNIFCIGRNYALHAKEMKSDVPEEPMVFLKPNSSVLFDGGTVNLPGRSSDVHHEVEMVIAIGQEGHSISLNEASNFIEGVAVGIDFTARDIQSRAKQEGKPWTVAKGFDTFAPVSHFIRPDESLNPDDLSIELKVNDKITQSGHTSNMIFPVTELINYLSSIFTLQPGDLIFTGTPEGVGPVKRGDRLSANLNQSMVTLNVDIQ